ncbi:MAG: DinB family protein [Anaerolineae bacterium]
MSEPLCASVLSNLRSAIALLAETIGQFTEPAWTRSGIDRFHVPVTIAMHTVECLDYYFRRDTATPWAWGGWWQHPDDVKPSPAELLSYLQDVAQRVELYWTVLTDADLSQPYTAGQEHSQSHLRHAIYAIRHTMQHHGALSLLALHAGYPSGHWE